MDLEAERNGSMGGGAKRFPSDWHLVRGRARRCYHISDEERRVCSRCGGSGLALHRPLKVSKGPIIGKLFDLPERIVEKIDPEPMSGCWLWNAADRSGYGTTWKEGARKGDKDVLAHVEVYERLVGPIPRGLELDHLCRVPSCVNPAHLEPVTHRENILRGISPAAIHARKTECPKGHKYDGENLYRRPDGSRLCRACRILRDPPKTTRRRRR